MYVEYLRGLDSYLYRFTAADAVNLVGHDDAIPDIYVPVNHSIEHEL